SVGPLRRRTLSSPRLGNAYRPLDSSRARGVEKPLPALATSVHPDAADAHVSQADSVDLVYLIPLHRIGDVVLDLLIDANLLGHQRGTRARSRASTTSHDSPPSGSAKRHRSLSEQPAPTHFAVTLTTSI